MQTNDKGKISRDDAASRLQAEIDQLLSDIGHLFDDMAEYSGIEYDSINCIDIDEVLKMELRAAKTAREHRKRDDARRQHAVHSNRISVFSRNSSKLASAYERSLPTNPQKVVVAMPEELQRVMRVSERRMQETLPRRITKFLFRRFEY